MKRIIIVDDDAILRKNLNEYFTEKGYEVETADSGKSGLQSILSRETDVILLDIMMPDLNGIEVLKEVSAKKKDTLKKIIITTNASDMEFLSEALELGVSSYFLKSNMSLENIFATAEEKVAQVIL